MNRKIFIGAVALFVLAGLIGATPAVLAQQDQAALEADANVPAAGSDIDVLIAEASAENGERIGRICGSCHNLSLRGGEKIGPNLVGVPDRWIAGLAGYPYSPALTNTRLKRGKSGPAIVLCPRKSGVSPSSRWPAA